MRKCGPGVSMLGGLLVAACAGTPPQVAPQAPAPSPSGSASAPIVAPKLDPFEHALSSARRTQIDRARDAARHPRATLEFFGTRPTSRVLELEAGDGYYTRILGEYLEPTEDGHSRLSVLAPFIAQHVFTAPQETGPLLDRWLDLQKLTQGMEPPAELLPGSPLATWSAPARFDQVLSFRFAHVLRARKLERSVYAAVHAALVPGGVFGVIAHRAPKDNLVKGYLAESSVVDSVTRAGFELEGRSEINANPKDTRDYPHGVWSLPPTAADGPKYAQVGESDRMTLLFRRTE